MSDHPRPFSPVSAPRHRCRRPRRGAVYLLVLSTAMIVTVLGVTGLLAVRVQHRTAQLDADMLAARTHARSAAELAAWHLQHDPDWASLDAEQRSRDLSDASGFDFTYQPARDGLTLEESRCDAIRIEAAGRHGQARALLEVRVEPRPLTTHAHRVALLDRVPLAYWPLDEAAGSTAAELLNERDGIYHAVDHQLHDATICLHAPGFDGEQSVVEVPHHPAFTIDSGSVVLWFRTDEPQRTQGLLSKAASGLGDGGHLSVRVSGGRVEASLASTAEHYTVIADTTIQADRWHHVVLTFGEGGLHLYLDGQPVSSSAYTGGLGPTSGGSGNTEPIAIGAETASSSAGSIEGYSDPLLGQLLDVALFNLALSAEEVAAIYEEGRLDRRYRAAVIGWRDRVN